jgi:hypothetical protein
MTVRTFQHELESPFAVKPKRHSYLMGPVYDSIFFLLTPLLALGAGFMVSTAGLSTQEIGIEGSKTTISEFFVSIFVMAHVFIVLFRSHLNKKVFKRNPYRFTLVPVALTLAFIGSQWALVIGMVVATFWDVYHCSLQTFGLARLYDVRSGNDSHVGRRLDYWLNIVIYAGPIAAGLTLMDHVAIFREFHDVGAVFLSAIPMRVHSWQGTISSVVIASGSLFIVYYLYSYWKLYRNGYQVSIQKVVLLSTTGICCLYAWGFNSFGEGFLITNFMHSLQYFGVIWWSERGNMVNVLRLPNFFFSRALVLLLILATSFGYGYVGVMFRDHSRVVLSIALMLGIMHYWYDGFIWSVRKEQI